MELQHAIGHFRYSDGKVSVVKFNDDVEILASKNDGRISDLLLKELRWPQYRERLIHANILMVKKVVAESVSTDTHIIQSINAVAELDKICNTLVKRVREWYSYYYPELSHRLDDNEQFIKTVLSKSKQEMMMQYEEKDTMGPEIAQKDLDMIISFARQVDDMYLERSRIINYIENTTMNHCPNIYSITGGLIAAKLIEKAGSLRHLAMLPSSTVQLFGAEKALFRHLRNKKIRPPKHGLILSHPFVMNAKRQDKGKAARTLAAKITIAARVDYFKGEFVGDRLKEDLDKMV